MKTKKAKTKEKTQKLGQKTSKNKAKMTTAKFNEVKNILVRYIRYVFGMILLINY